MAKDYELEINDKDSEFGEPGPQGEPGKDGRDGVDGKNGKDGRDGKDGKDGIKGDTGPRGLTGLRGPAGSDGKNGKDGINGIDGRDGKNGESLQFKWDGTKLGIKKTTDDVFKFTELAPKTVNNSTNHALASSPGRIRATTTGTGSSLINGQANNHVTFKSLAQGTNITLVDDGSTITINSTGGGGGTPGGTPGQIQYNNTGAFGGFTLSGDATINTGTGAITFTTVNANVGTFGNATNVSTFTVNAKGLITAASNTPIQIAESQVTNLTTDLAAKQVTVSLTTTGTSGAATFNSGTGALNIPQYATTSLAFSGITGGTNTTAAMVVGTGASLAVSGSGTIAATSAPIAGITGLGTGVATALAVNVGTAGAFVVNGGVLGTPSSGTLTNATGLPIVAGTTGTLTEVRGGTNQTTYTLGDILYSSAANTLSKLAGNTVATKQFLSQTGTGAVSAAPVWGVLASGDIPNNAANTTGTATNATNVTITNDTATATACFPTWVTANTGNLPLKVTSTKFSFVPSTGAVTITSADANAFAIGLNGATNPAIQIDASTASSDTGFAFKSGVATFSGTLISSATNAGGTWQFSKGSATAQLSGSNLFQVNAGGTLQLMSGGSVIAQIFGAGCTFGSNFRGFQNGTNFTFSGSTDSNLTSSAEALDMDLNFAQVKTHGTGALTTQRSLVYRPSTHAYAAASAITNMYGLSIVGGPVAGANNTTTTLVAFNIETASCVNTGTVTNSYAEKIAALSGATNNYIASWNGSAGEVLRARTDGQIVFLGTIAGATGAQTINQPSGQVQFAAAATSLVVTNSLVTANSLVFATVASADTTMKTVSVQAAAGSFTLTANAAATATCKVNFWVIN